MRFISKFAMTVAAIFFALSVSAHADSYYLLKSKQVCNKWVKQAGMQGVLTDITDRIYSYRVLTFYSEVEGGVNSIARTFAKDCLRGLGECPTENHFDRFGL